MSKEDKRKKAKRENAAILSEAVTPIAEIVPAAVTVSAADRDDGMLRRRARRSKGRVEPFSTKLTLETRNYIYGVANDRDIPIAQVIEEMVAAHRAQPT